MTRSARLMLRSLHRELSSCLFERFPLTETLDTKPPIASPAGSSPPPHFWPVLPRRERATRHSVGDPDFGMQYARAREHQAEYHCAGWLSPWRRRMHYRVRIGGSAKPRSMSSQLVRFVIGEGG